jgi:hyperosmotically inducible periplasmic protein
MKSGWQKAAVAASSLVMLLALGACGARMDNPEPQAAADHPSVEVDRQAQARAQVPQPVTQAQAQQVDTTTMGAAPAVAPAASPVATEDQRIATDVKQALATDADLGAMKIDVASDFGLVTLRGRAPDPQARDRAGELARGVSGVKTVDNMLTLG